MASNPEPVSVLFVCLGNICRSTMAEGIFRAIVSQPPYRSLISVVDSCGTGAYHVGSSPDSRTLSTLADNGITDYRHAARKASPFYYFSMSSSLPIDVSDFSTFDFIFAMDRDNLRDLQRLQQRSGGKAKAKVMLFGEYAGRKGAKEKVEEVDDPYYGGRDGFEAAYEQCTRFSTNFLKDVFPDVEA
ncbi:phosphotyrosine protein phosphatase [Drepanopeziza brunnea f. sp. 'multigermtubi' MB_m1]|uniref:Phosphotyrosine protein phosphatase n=1 Tax=Marssonina brunnea f. sp. multigermtubi (strain MB_m1) TaxID=1072389 RepID=K1W940_MARBU|nr:phosphotyrosine protein phosphatase [Drepanopeziza brunnea f. sp. 'multigermtubi' MB_m1]EKD13730.1 phosphotyrosine protein phosphatase [Drepanopeziza brunnea f. sp. 'multigermtubi' MB_m1]